MLGNFEMTKSRPDSLSGVSPKQFLDDVAKDSCAHFGVTLEELRSSARFARLVTARTWVTQTALQFGTATLAEIARYLNRDESTLRQALRRKAGSAAGKVSPVSPL
jgi:chromosomal replication initiation ATPase DnaA